MCNFFRDIKQSYQECVSDFTDYFLFFGSIKEVIIAPYFHLATLLAILTSFFGPCPMAWSDFALGGLPSLLGFSIGGYAIIVTFGDSDFREFLIVNQPEKDKPLLLIVNGIFIHFILVQTLALTLAALVKLLNINATYINAVLSISFFYSIMLCASIAFSIKTVSQWYVKFVESKRELEKQLK